MARVLLVDDDAGGLEVRKLILEQHGHHVTCAADSASARAAFQAMAPETVIMDLRLPDPEDGLALICEFRAAAARARIVVLSGWSADLDGREERALVDEVLIKPVRSELILRAIGYPN
jgi:DNA-binding response OmpR family regulator